MKVKMKLSASGFASIKLFEGLKLRAYKDKAGVWTIGYGSTCLDNGRAVKAGDVLGSAAVADALFRVTMQQYEAAVNYRVTVQLNQNEFDALVSFTYNEGVGALAKSTLLQLLNAGNRHAAADEFLQWDKITDPNTGAHVVCDDLVLRRRKERLTFLKPAA